MGEFADEAIDRMLDWWDYGDWFDMPECRLPPGMAQPELKPSKPTDFPLVNE